VQHLEEDRFVEVKIGVQHAHRELVIESVQSADDVAKAVSEALTSESGVLNLIDDKGRRVIVPAAKLAYVEIDETVVRKVGFTAN
jgi:Protein of unknown function (DUF3107)